MANRPIRREATCRHPEAVNRKRNIDRPPNGFVCSAKIVAPVASKPEVKAGRKRVGLHRPPHRREDAIERLHVPHGSMKIAFRNMVSQLGRAGGAPLEWQSPDGASQAIPLIHIIRTIA
jgi:hypothetical protein